MPCAVLPAHLKVWTAVKKNSHNLYGFLCKGWGKEGEGANMGGQERQEQDEAYIEDGQVEEEAHAVQANCQNIF